MQVETQKSSCHLKRTERQRKKSKCHISFACALGAIGRSIHRSKEQGEKLLCLGVVLLCTRKVGKKDSSAAVVEKQQAERIGFPAGISVRPAWFSILNLTDSRNTGNS